MRIFVIGQSWSHMGRMSGFPLAEVLAKASQDSSVVNLERLHPNSKSSIFRRAARKLYIKKIVALTQDSSKCREESGTIYTNNRHIYIAAIALSKLRADPGAILVLSVAEEQYCSILACAAPEIKKRIYVCCHQPPSSYRLYWRNLKDFDSLGGIICLSKDQASFFRLLCNTPVLIIKHGVRHDFFTPPKDSRLKRGNRLIFVGQWLRDFETLSLTMNLIWARLSDVCLECVVPRSARNSPHIRRLASDGRAQWHSDLSDVQLKRLYQSSDLMLLPVTDAVANNAVVEALSAGLPIVTSSVPGMMEYIPSEVGSFCSPGNAYAHAEAVINWIHQPAKRQAAGEIARQHTLANYDWGQNGAVISSFLLKESQTSSR